MNTDEHKKRMSIYIASSWKNQHAVEMLTHLLRALDFQVLSFVDNNFEEEHREDIQFDVVKWIWSDKGEQAFGFDTGHAMCSDAVVYIGPSGTDAWAEVGAAFAKMVPIFGLWAKGEPAGLMRRMMISWHHDFRALIEELKELRRIKEKEAA